MQRKEATRSLLKAQREELVALRGDRTIDEWAALLSVPKRTYYRYEMGQRAAKESLMKLARLKKKRG